jgi:hypothetical protein
VGGFPANVAENLRAEDWVAERGGFEPPEPQGLT